MKPVDKYTQVPLNYLDGVGNLMFSEHSSPVINKKPSTESYIHDLLNEYNLYEDYFYLGYLAKAGMLTSKDINTFLALIDKLPEKDRIKIYSLFLFQ